MMRIALALLTTLAGCAQPPAQPSFVLISLDTLRADRLGAYGYADAITPNLDAFAAEGVLFERAWAQANVTNMSHASMFASRYASELGPAVDGFVPAPDIPLMAEILQAYGYQTAASVGGSGVVEGLGLERGFDSFERPAPLGMLYHTGPNAIAQLDTLDRERPWLLFVHAYDTHVRYLKPSPVGLLHTEPGYTGPASRLVQDPVGTTFVLDEVYYEDVDLGTLIELRGGRPWGAENRAAIPARAETLGASASPLAPRDLQQLWDAYDGAVSYMDAHFGLLMAELDARGALDEAWVIVVSDHGESLGEDGLVCHNLALSDASLQVPLIIRPPGGLDTGLRVAEQADLLDLLPTVLAIAGAQPPALMQGQSLLPAIEGEAWTPREHSFAEGLVRAVTARSEQGRLTFSGVSAESPLLVPLLAGAQADGPAFEPFTTVTGEQQLALREALLAWRQDLRPSQRQLPPPSQKQLEAMRKHGYWSTR